MEALAKHLKSRGMKPENYNIWYGKNIITFPLYSFGGQLIGYQQYRPDAPKHAENPKEARYFTRMYGNGQSVWGLDAPLYDDDRIIFLTESIFKSTAIHNIGRNSWAILGSNISIKLLQQLRLLPFEFICIGDNDKAGIEFADTFKRGIVKSDIDELSADEVNKLCHPFR